VVGARIAYRADEPRAPGAGQREHGEEVRLVEVDVQLAVDRWAAALDVGHVEDLPVGTPRKAGAERLAHQRARPVAAGEIACGAALLHTRGGAQPRHELLALLGEADKLGAPLDADAERREPLEQQPLVFVLGKDLEESIARQVRADGLEGDTRRALTERPQVDRGHLVAVLDHRLRQVQLLIQFEGACLHRERARGGTRFRGAIDDAHLDTETREPQGQHQSRRAGAGDQHLAVHVPRA